MYMVPSSGLVRPAEVVVVVDEDEESSVMEGMVAAVVGVEVEMVEEVARGGLDDYFY